MSVEPNNSGEQIPQAAAAPASVVNETQSGQSGQEQQVPLAALQAERAQRQRMEDELKLIKDHLSLLQASQPQNAPSAQKDELAGLSDSDVLTVGDFKKLASSFNQNVQMSIGELKMMQKYPDYHDVITKYLPDVLKTNPSLQSTLQKTQDYELAYYLAKNSDTYRVENKKTVRNADAERIVANANQAGSLSSLGASSPALQAAKRYKDMSDDDFRLEMARNRGYS